MASSPDHAVAEAIVPQAGQSKGVPRPAIRKVLRVKVIIRLLIICSCGCLTGYLLFNSPWWLAGLWTAAITLFFFFELIRFIERSERQLAFFLLSLRQNDFSVSFTESQASYDLHTAFNELTDTFTRLRADKESQHHLLQAVIETASVPIICFEERSGSLYLINEAATKMLDLPFFRNIKSLSRVDAALPGLLAEIRDGEKQTIAIRSEGKSIFLSLTSRHLRFQGRNLKIVAMPDVSSELAVKEAETWQKLLRVLTHEISNSAIPLSTLSEYIFEKLRMAEGNLAALTPEERSDILNSLKTIGQRSASLKRFVQNFRHVNTVPEPQLARVSLNMLLGEVCALFARDFEKEKITVKITGLSNEVSAMIDKDLTMQVLINLIRNAIESMTNFREGKNITLAVEKSGRYVNVHVIDNGCGIPADLVDQIFIPFYSTKKTGSGIGLSISRQIMQKQKGDIAVSSAPGQGSVFSLCFLT